MREQKETLLIQDKNTVNQMQKQYPLYAAVALTCKLQSYEKGYKPPTSEKHHKKALACQVSMPYSVKN